ncbi:hypothetical protein U9M48_038418 [Paspalum notatum var. saurae]|uniref:F-box domain-containing protein n=1 Tax=Paspalum notatum var. saurae TaxID=547442 RepID=A0AAQ3UIH5_PASNO
MATAPPTPIGGEETAAVHEGWNLPTDVFVEILLLLPAIIRWRLRLVCRHWRDRTPATDNPPVPLAFVVNYSDLTHKKLWASAHAIDDLAEGRCREAWRSKLVPEARRYSKWERRYVPHDDGSDPAMVGTCNGLVCLCDDAKPGGAIAVVNPATGERLVVPPLPGSAQWVRCWDTGMRGGWHEAYSFAYHPSAAQYKVVHVPCYFDRSGGFSELQVFTLGHPSWRNVPAAGPVPGGATTCRLEAGIVSLVHGVTHWITKDTDRVVSFDVKEERIASTTALPVRSDHGYTWRLTEVRGRLGFVSSPVNYWRAVKLPQIIDVWVLGAAGSQGWSHRYSVEMWVPKRQQELAWPHFEHGGYVLTTTTKTWNSNGDKQHVYAHRMRLVAGRKQRDEGVRSVRITERGQQLVNGITCSSIRGVFAYAKTEEPLSAYKA